MVVKVRVVANKWTVKSEKAKGGVSIQGGAGGSSWEEAMLDGDCTSSGVVMARRGGGEGAWQ